MSTIAILGKSMMGGSTVAFTTLLADTSATTGGGGRIDFTVVLLALLSGTGIVGLVLSNLDKRADRKFQAEQAAQLARTKIETDLRIEEAKQAEASRLEAAKMRDGEVGRLWEWCRVQDKEIAENKKYADEAITKLREAKHAIAEQAQVVMLENASIKERNAELNKQVRNNNIYYRAWRQAGEAKGITAEEVQKIAETLCMPVAGTKTPAPAGKKKEPSKANA